MKGAAMANEDPVLKTALAKLTEGVTYKDLVAILAPKAAALAVPAEPPLPAVITDDQKAALERLPEVFGSVVPVERRDLLPSEASKLLEERDVLKKIATMAADREQAIRTTVLNAHDVRLEESGEDLSDVERDKDGHYIRKGEVRAESGAGQRFSVEARSGSASVNPDLLRALAADENEPWFTHDDYLKMTTQTRVFDEEKTMIALRTNPALLKALRHATVPGRGSVAVQPRKA
jgi:hypothetical protein